MSHLDIAIRKLKKKKKKILNQDFLLPVSVWLRFSACSDILPGLLVILAHLSCWFVCNVYCNLVKSPGQIRQVPSSRWTLPRTQLPESVIEQDFSEFLPDFLWHRGSGMATSHSHSKFNHIWTSAHGFHWPVSVLHFKEGFNKL